MRILHVFRTPIGGLFRHVRDLARGQHESDHAVGIVCDSTTGGDSAEELLRVSTPHCELGIHRIPISRLPGLGDLSGVRQVLTLARRLAPDIIHCHGAKGGLYGRLAGRILGTPTVYTPHGGSLHYTWSTPSGFAFLAAESLLARIGSGLHFVCNYEREQFDAKIGLGTKPAVVIHNGLWPEDFVSTVLDIDAADILFIGDMRHLKGVDILLEALSLCGSDHPLTASLVGDGPDLDRFKVMAQRLGLSRRVNFLSRIPANVAFRHGRLLVIPSRAESFPYIVLEAMAAGKSIIASAVGGIPEVLPEQCLVAPGDPALLAHSMIAALANAGAYPSKSLQARLSAGIGAQQMADEIVDFYGKLMPCVANGGIH